jgi:hypothetical protein
VTTYVETRCAVCQLSDGLVVNIIMAVPSDPAQDGCQLVEVMNDQPCDIGWYWDGATFVDPNPPAPTPPREPRG